MLIGRWILLSGVLAACIAASDPAKGDAPFIPQAEDAKHLAPAGSSGLFWTAEQKVSGFRNMDALFPTRSVIAGASPLELKRSLRELGEVKLQHGDVTMTVDDYFVSGNVAGLLVIRGNTILYERYGLGNTEDSRWVSYSVAKSVVSMLIGAAIEDGYIGSVDEKVTDYLPRLKHSSYDQATIRNLLQMSSGVAWNEDYADRTSDVATADWATLNLYELLRNKPQAAAPGELFNYNTAETNLAGTLLRAAIGNNLSTYLSEKIWRPFGMESDAFWQLTEPGGGEFGGCCINATLRDYGRIGMFALNNGRLPDGTRVLPANWMTESVTPSRGAAYYGYFWWLKPDGSYSASGIFGQGIYVNPQRNVVIALHSARDGADEGFELQDALFDALSRAVSDQ